MVRKAKRSSKSSKKASKIDHHGTKRFLIAVLVILGIIIIFLTILALPKMIEIKETIITPTQESSKEITPQEKQQTIIQTKDGIIISDFNKQMIFDEIKSCTNQIDQKTIFTKQFIEAINTKNPQKCVGFESFCKAKIDNDATICQDQEQKEYCTAIITENKNLCKEDKTCKAFATKNVQECLSLEGLEKASCTLMATRNIAGFEKEITDQKILCSDSTYSKYAVLYEIKQLCENIVDDSIMNDCQSKTSNPSAK